MFNVKVLSDTPVMCTICIRSQVLMDTPDCYPWLTSQAIHNQIISSWYLVQQPVSQVSTNSYASIENYSTPNQLSIERPVIVNQGVDGVLIEYWLHVNQEYWSTLDRWYLW